MDAYPQLTQDDEAMLRLVLANFGNESSVAGFSDLAIASLQECMREDIKIDSMAMLEQLLINISNCVPQGMDCIESTMTTLMIRNIPRRCTQRMLMSDIIMTGYENLVDFVYLPTDISSGRNLGYAFLNFMEWSAAESFRQSFHKKHLSAIRGSRAGLSVSFAIIQGLEANIENVLKTAAVHRIRNPEYLPLIRGTDGYLVPCNLVVNPQPMSIFSPQSTCRAH